MTYNAENRTSFKLAQDDIKTGSRPGVRVEGMSDPFHPLNSPLDKNHMVHTDDDGFAEHLYKIGSKYGRSLHGLNESLYLVIEKRVKSANPHFDDADVVKAADAVYRTHNDPEALEQMENQTFEYFEDDYEA